MPNAATNVEAARELADRFWDRLLEQEPLLGTQVGDERFDDRLPDPSETGIAAREALYRGALEELALIDRAALSLDDRTTLDVLEAIARREVDSIRFRLDRLYAVNHLLGPGNLLADVAQMQLVDTPERLGRFVARLHAFPEYLDAVGKVAMDGARVGQTVPAIVADRAVAQVERLLSIPAEESPALIGLAKASNEDRQRVIQVVRDRVNPAVGRYLDVLRDYRPSARDSLAMTALRDGDAMYASQVLAYTTLPLDAGVVHRTGLDELEGIERERREIAERLGYPDAESAIAARQESGANTAASREDLVRIVEEQVQRGWEVAQRFFGRVPKANCVIKQVEEFREKDTPMAFYQQPTADGARPGAYYINTGDLDHRPLHLLAGITYHEANPGHHFQVSIEQEFVDPGDSPLRGDPGGQRVRRGVGPVLRAAGRRDGAVPGRLRATRDARRTGLAGEPADRGHRDPRVGVDARRGHRPDGPGRRAHPYGRGRSGPLHRLARTGAGLQGGTDRDPAVEA